MKDFGDSYAGIDVPTGYESTTVRIQKYKRNCGGERSLVCLEIRNWVSVTWQKLTTFRDQKQRRVRRVTYHPKSVSSSSS